jgi:hypothetical protein
MKLAMSSGLPDLILLFHVLCQNEWFPCSKYFLRAWQGGYFILRIGVP